MSVRVNKMKKIKWGIVGPGNIANKFAKAVKNVEGAELVAVASRSEERGKEFASKYDIPNIYSSYDKMACSDVDAVYISTPHPFHKPCAELFLNAGKHVLCEKPVCVNSEDAITLKECAEKNNVFLMEAMWTRFLPAIDEALRIVKSGEIGEIRGLSADFCYSTTPEEEEKLFLSTMAGGSLLDVGIYGLTLASIFLGNNPVEINATSDVKNCVDYHTSITLKYENGEIANITSAINVMKPENGFIYGTKGYITLPHFYGATEIIVNSIDGERRVSKPCIGDGFEEEIIEACNCIREGKRQSDIMPMSESIKMLELMDTIRAQTGVRYPFEKM